MTPSFLEIFWCLCDKCLVGANDSMPNDGEIELSLFFPSEFWCTNCFKAVQCCVVNFSKFCAYIMSKQAFLSDFSPLGSSVYFIVHTSLCFINKLRTDFCFAFSLCQKDLSTSMLAFFIHNVFRKKHKQENINIKRKKKPKLFIFFHFICLTSTILFCILVYGKLN